MLDGLLGRGFAAKCKSLIKLIKSRIDVIRRKRKATEKFLKKDIADLLGSGLDVNAYGRADALIVELTVSSCYDFIEQSCEFVLKHLSVMQKLSGCPEECREAVSSLMLAAARFSDLPELRDLRQIFQERYGNSLECYVNQEFAASLNLRSSTLEKKINLMQEISSEFSVKWDSKAFEQRMLKPSAFAQDHRSSNTNHLTDYNKPSHGKDGALKGVKYDVLFERSPGLPSNGLRDHNGMEAAVSKRDDNDLQSRSKPPKYRSKQQNGCDEVILKSDSHDNPLPERQEITAKKSDRRYWKEGGMLKPIGQGGSSQCNRAEQFEDGSSRGNINPQRENQDTASARKPFAVNYGGLIDTDNCERMFQKDETPRAKTYYNSAIPPPYVKSNSKQKNGKSRANVIFSHEGNGIPAYPSQHDKPDAATTSEKIQLGLDNSDQERQVSRNARLSGQSHEKELSVHEVAAEVPVLKSKSTRRKHSKSRSSHYDASVEFEDTRVMTRKLKSRRRDDSRRGLQILFDDEQYQNHEEERIIDKLLIHYSKKPSTPEPEKIRRKSKSHHAHHVDKSAGEYLRNGSGGKSEEIPEMNIVPPRSVSLPHEQTETLEVDKVFTRAASFEPGRSNTARHVHPKLPDYDDLAARFAALRGR